MSSCTGATRKEFTNNIVSSFLYVKKGGINCSNCV